MRLHYTSVRNLSHKSACGGALGPHPVLLDVNVRVIFAAHENRAYIAQGLCYVMDWIRVPRPKSHHVVSQNDDFTPEVRHPLSPIEICSANDHPKWRGDIWCRTCT